jgi:hypothetical protein
LIREGDDHFSVKYRGKVGKDEREIAGEGGRRTAWKGAEKGERWQADRVVEVNPGSTTGSLTKRTFSGDTDA